MHESLSRDQRRRRRELLRRHHPDLGGSAEDFTRLLMTYEVGSTRGSAVGAEIRFVRRPRGLGRVTAWARRYPPFRKRRPPRVV